MDVHPRLRHGRMNKAPPTAPRAHILVKRLMQETLRSDMKETLIWATAWRNTHNPLNFHNHHCAGAARNNRVKCQATQRHGSFNIRNPSPSRDLHPRTTASRNTHNPLNFHNHHCAGAARSNRVKCQATQRHGSINIRKPSPNHVLHPRTLNTFTTNTLKGAKSRGRRKELSAF